jgi:glycosyltransferase involved in cell wall biosynthesis
LAASLGLGGDVIFEGPREDLTPAYQAADLFVLTSDHEGTPNVVLEAMSSGLPVVATRTGGTTEIVQESVTGILADPADETTLAEAVLTLVEDNGLRCTMGVHARARVEQRYSLEALPAALQRIYSAALQ